MRRQQIDHILKIMSEAYDSVSDINVTVDKPLQVESEGQLMPVSLTPSIDRLTNFQTEVFALSLINGDRRLTKTLLTKGSCDFSYQFEEKTRFRANVFSQKGCYSTVMRQLPTRIPTIEGLKLPPAFFKMPKEKNGIIFITGATGTGKTTSLAAILNEINNRESVHIITLEDPLEFVHPQKKATFNQRELGIDFNAFSYGLRSALRQAPKVVLVGEMRDRETMEIGLTAAETGHLVLSSLHTVDAGQTISRIVGMISYDEERQVRVRLANVLRWIVCQRLLPRVGGGRVATFEIMGSNPTVKDTVLHGESESKTFYEIIERNLDLGMMTFDQHIAGLFKQGLITEETAISFASRKSVVGRFIDSIKASRGEKTTSIKDLSIDKDYGKHTKR